MPGSVFPVIYFMFFSILNREMLSLPGFYGRQRCQNGNTKQKVRLVAQVKEVCRYKRKVMIIIRVLKCSHFRCDSFLGSSFR